MVCVDASLSSVAFLLVLPPYAGPTVRESVGGRESQSTQSATLVILTGGVRLQCWPR